MSWRQYKITLGFNSSVFYFGLKYLKMPNIFLNNIEIEILEKEIMIYMLDLLKQYSVQDILIFIVILAIAIKGCISFFDWAYTRIKQHFDKDNTEINKEKQTHLAIQTHTKSINTLIKAQEQNIKQFDALQKSIEMLIESDKDDIKS